MLEASQDISKFMAFLFLTLPRGFIVRIDPASLRFCQPSWIGSLGRCGGRVKTGRSVKTARLEADLEKLKSILGLGHDLVLFWEPASNPLVKGELRGRVLLVYEPDPRKARRILIHEFLEFCLSQYYLGPALFARSGILTTHARHAKEQLISALATVLEKVLKDKET
jgi:hypothetical protein